MKAGSHIFDLWLNIYPIRITFIVNKTDRWVNNFLKTHIEADMMKSHTMSMDGVNGLCRTLETGTVIIRLKDLDTLPRFHSVVAHEALHASIHALRHVGVKLTQSSEEAYTYLMDYIIREFYKVVKPVE